MADPFPEFPQYDAVGMAELIRCGEVTPADLLETAVARIERYNPRLNVVVRTLYDHGREELSRASEKLRTSSLFGVPFLVKDLMLTYAGVPTTGSCVFYRDLVPEKDSYLMRRFRQAGLITLGKTNAPELGIVSVTESRMHGICRNPWDLSRSPGGSSGGSAAAVAARLVPAAHGNDGGGSIRIPASASGVVGLKPSRGRNPAGPRFLQPVFGLAEEHVLSRTVRDSAAFLDATNGRAIDTPFGLPRNEHSYLKATSRPPTPLRIAFTREPLLGSSMHPDCAAGLDRTVALCEELGHELHEAGPGLDNRRLMEAYFVLTSLALAEELNTMARLTGIKANARTLEDITFFLKRLGDSMSGRRFADAHADMLNATRSLALFFESYDVLLTPTMAVPPLPTGSMDLPFREKCLLRMLGRLGVSPLMDLALRVIAPRAFDYTPNTQLFNLSGFPAVSLPLAWNDQGLPIGMQFGASFGREDLLLSLAAQLEEARPWAARMPADFE